MASTTKLTKTQAALLRQIADGARVLMVGQFTGAIYVTERNPGHHDYERVNKATFYGLLDRLMVLQGTRAPNDTYNRWFEITEAGKAALAAYDASGVLRQNAKGSGERRRDDER
jgi:hypothetical protein